MPARAVRPIWAETCPHYLFQTEDVLDRPGMEGAKWMCSPPQRTRADQAALWAGIAAGHIQIVSSDHAPYRFDATGKFANGFDAPFPAIANGMPGLEPRLPLMFDAMVNRGHLGLASFARLNCEAPASLYGLRGKGRIAPDMTLIWCCGISHKAAPMVPTTCTTMWATTRGRARPSLAFPRPYSCAAKR